MKKHAVTLLMALTLTPLGVTALSQTSSPQPTTSGVDYREVRWSPDGKSLAVVLRTDPKARFRIAIIPAAGGEPRWLTPETSHGSMPRWSPDGREVAFVSQKDPTLLEFDLLVANVSGGPTRRVASARNQGMFQFILGYTWTPDGKGFEYFVQSPEAERGHYVVDLEGRKTRTPTAESIGHMSGVEWSPDHSQVAFQDDEPGVFVVRGKARVPATRIYLAGRHGENPRPLSRTGDLPQAPSWSPDGKTILYSLFQRPINGPTLWSINTDGTRSRSLAADGIRGQFSPDGQWIAYIDTRGVDTPDNPSGSSFYKRVCKARPDGSGVVVLAR